MHEIHIDVSMLIDVLPCKAAAVEFDTEQTLGNHHSLMRYGHESRIHQLQTVWINIISSNSSHGDERDECDDDFSSRIADMCI